MLVMMPQALKQTTIDISVIGFFSTACPYSFPPTTGSSTYVPLFTVNL